MFATRCPSCFHLMPDIKDSGSAGIPENQHLDTYTVRRIERIIKITSSCKQGNVLLDIGCGRGLLSRLIRNGPSYVGLDLSIVPLKARWLGWKWDMRVASCLPIIPFRTCSVDMIICTEVIEHLSYDAGRSAMQDIYRILKPMGYLILSTPNGGSLSYRIRKFIGVEHPDPNQEHIALYNWATLLDLMRSIGFREIKREPFDIVMEPTTPQAFIAMMLPARLRLALTRRFIILDQLIILNARKRE